MALIQGTNVAIEYFKSTIANLYPDSTLVPGVTFNPNTIVKAGGRYIPKLTKGSVNSPKLPGQKYDLTGVKDTLVPIMANNSQTPGYEIYEAQMASTSYNVLDEAIKDLTAGKLTPALNLEGISCLVNEGTDMQDTTAITKDNIRDYLITLRKKMRDKGAKGTTLIVNTEVYAAILSVAGKDFDNEIKNQLNLSANIGTWLGWTVVESNVFSFYTEGKYIDYSGTEKTVDLSAIDLIAYDKDIFYIDTLINMMKAQDATTFNGIEVVSEVINGYRVGDAEQVFVKKNK
jgi:hypothetical protein